MRSSARSKKSAGRTSKPRFAIAVMAAGKGTRLKSRHPKVLHEVGGKPLLAYVIDTATRVLPAANVYVIIGHEAERVRRACQDTGVNFVLQAKQLGTGHAIMCAREALAPYQHLLVVSGDAPLLRPQTLAKMRDFHLRQKAAMTILSAELADPTGYGRIIRKGGNNDRVAEIVEQKKLTPGRERVREINSGTYAFDMRALLKNIDKLGTDNPHREFYLTDMAAILTKAGSKVVAFRTDACETVGANDRSELAQLDAQLRQAKCAQLMAAGVTIFRPETCVIDADVQVGPDTVVEPFVQLLGRTRIGSDCRIRSYSLIEHCELGDRVTVRPGCVLEQSRIGNDALLGPYCHLRPGSDIADEAHVGNFVEMKKARLGRGSKANHLTYLGDAIIGDEVNVGAGTITCNFDGEKKHVTVIEDGAFIGSDTTLVAPVKIGRGAYVGAAACVTEDVPEESLAIARARQINKEGWVRKKREEMAARKTSGQS